VARFFLLFLTVVLPVLAQDDPMLEKRVANLADELRCLVCQNQTLAESTAPLAVDLRNQIREQLKAGKTERDVRAFMVERYGDFVLYRPPFKATTLLLWIGPFLLLALGIWLFYRRVAQRHVSKLELSDADRARLAKLLE
jgi:cytochrome c-type biogenesis protein CcmH